MATYTALTDQSLEPGQPWTSLKALAVRDNPVAIAEGASGAPRIVNAAVTNGTLGAEKFQTPGTTERDWVLASVALAGVGAVGTYAFLERDSTADDLTPGETIAGSGLIYSGLRADGTVSRTGITRPAGTWRVMGDQLSSGQRPITLFLRIS